MSNQLLQIILNSSCNNVSISLLQSCRPPADMLVFHPSHSSQVLQPDTEEILSSPKPSLTCHQPLPTSQDRMIPIRVSHCQLLAHLRAAATHPAPPSTCRSRAVLSDHSDICERNVIVSMGGKEKTDSSSCLRTGSGSPMAGAATHHR